VLVALIDVAARAVVVIVAVVVADLHGG